MNASRTVAALASRQHGVVLRAQLLASGLSAATVARWVRAGRLHPVHRGVYLVGHAAAPPLSRQMAAVLACGPHAVISHRSAAAVWKLLPEPDAIEVTVVAGDRRRPGIVVHCTPELGRRDVRRLEGIPLTSPARTLLDLASSVPPGTLEQAVAEAQVRRLIRHADLREQMERNQKRPGTPALQALLRSHAPPAHTRSQAERRLLTLLRAAHLPRPEANARLHGYEVDLVWRARRLVVEIDGYRFHSSRRAFERDRRRDAELAAAGYVVIRVTWRQLEDEPYAVVARIAAALARAPG